MMQMLRVFGILLSLLLLCSCATEKAARLGLPADVTMNPEAGRGGWLIVTVRLEGGDELPFMVDTGSSGTMVDKSLVPRLGRRLDTVTVTHWHTKRKSDVYAAPRLYLGRTPLMMSRPMVATVDLKPESSAAGRPIMGVLGMNILTNYCLQLDFIAGKMRFLDAEHANKQKWGKAFPLTALGPHDRRPAVGGNLFGAKDARSLVDTGYCQDGWLMPNYFLQWTNQAILPTNGEAVSPDGVLGGESYHHILLAEEDFDFCGLGLLFLSRHLVTFDFPNQTLYLKRTRTSYGSLIDADIGAALNFLKGLWEKGRLPDWPKNVELAAEQTTYRIHYPHSVTFEARKPGDASLHHFTVSRTSLYGPWRLQKAWRTAQSDSPGDRDPKALADNNRAIDLSDSGSAKRARGDWDGALADLNQAIELKPDLAEAYDTRGSVKLAKEDWDGALADCAKAIELKPDSPGAYYTRGRARQGKGDREGALADLNQAIVIEPFWAEAYNARGHVRRFKGDLAGALADYNKAIELNPALADAYLNRGAAKAAKGDLAGALTDCGRAVELKPESAVARFSRGAVKVRLGDFDGALVDFNQAIEKNAKYARAYRSRGFLYYDLRAYAKALADLQKACELDPQDQDYASFYLWLIRARLGDQEAATGELHTYLENRKTGKPDDWPSKVGRYLTGQLSESDFCNAAENADKKKNDEQYCEAYFYAGSKRLIEGDKTAAAGYFEKCLSTGVQNFYEYRSAALELKYLSAGK
jgi:lipoprotein NlpI